MCSCIGRGVVEWHCLPLPPPWILSKPWRHSYTLARNGYGGSDVCMDICSDFQFLFTSCSYGILCMTDHVCTICHLVQYTCIISLMLFCTCTTLWCDCACAPLCVIMLAPYLSALGPPFVWWCLLLPFAWCMPKYVVCTLTLSHPRIWASPTLASDYLIPILDYSDHLVHPWSYLKLLGYPNLVYPYINYSFEIQTSLYFHHLCISTWSFEYCPPFIHLWILHLIVVQTSLIPKHTAFILWILPCTLLFKLYSLAVVLQWKYCHVIITLSLYLKQPKWPQCQLGL